jgi:hypothetical protein
MDNDSQNIYTKYTETKSPEKKNIDYPKALGYLEGVVKSEILRLKAYQKELDRPEINKVINELQIGLDKALEYAPRVEI